MKAMPGLDAALLELSNRPNAHWLDVGAGIGNAPLGFKKYGANAFETPRYENGRTNEPAPNPQNVSLTLLDLDIAPVAEPGVQTLSGRFIENISSEELPKADVVTDNIAAFSYSERPDLVLAKETSSLKPNGTLFLGLGQTMDTNIPAVHSAVISGDGVVRSYLEWLPTIEGLQVEARVRTKQDLEDVSPSEHFAAAITVKPGATPVIPSLELVHFVAGGPPRVLAMETGAALYQRPETARRLEAESQADLAHELNTAPTGTFLDLFRAGPVSNPLARALNRTRRWAHVGPISPVAIEDVRAGKVTATTRFGSVGEVLSSLRRLGRRSFEFDAVTSADEVTSTPDLITDSGVFASSTRPTEVLRKYFEAVGDDGRILLSHGGARAQSEVITLLNERVPISTWLKSLRGVDVSKHVRRGASASQDEWLTELRLTNRTEALESLRNLQPMGTKNGGAGFHALLLREDPAGPAPSEADQRMKQFTARLTKALW